MAALASVGIRPEVLLITACVSARYTFTASTCRRLRADHRHQLDRTRRHPRGSVPRTRQPIPGDHRKPFTMRSTVTARAVQFRSKPKMYLADTAAAAALPKAASTHAAAPAAVAALPRSPSGVGCGRSPRLLYVPYEYVGRVHRLVALRFLVTAAIVAGSLTLASCTTAVTSPASTTAPSASPSVRRSVVPVPTSVQRIPGQPPFIHYGTVDHPEIGVTYEYHLYVHCGVRAAKFGGRWWIANPHSGAEPPNDGSQYATGSMTLVAPDLARFEWDVSSADFAPASVEPLPCS